MSNFIKLAAFFVTLALVPEERSAQQGFIVSPDDFFARNFPSRRAPRFRTPFAPTPPSLPRTTSFRFPVSLPRPFFNRTSNLRRRNGCTRRQIRMGRCTPSTTPPPRSIDKTGNQPANIVQLRSEIRDLINEDHEMIPNLLQLVFHTCMGGCDGCLDFSERANRGLRETYSTVRQFWTRRASIITLADMVVLMASEAIEVGMDKDGGPGALSVAFRTGRSTCDDPDDYTKDITFPHGDSTDDIQVLIDEFSLSRKLSIALLGAHSVGRCHLANSGFAGKWDNTELTLDNHYYKSMIGTDWKSTRVPGGHQWNASRSDTSRMMLNSDLALFKNFTINSRNQASCTSSKRCDDSSDATQVRLYARQDQIWARDFIEAFQQMVNKDLS